MILEFSAHHAGYLDYLPRDQKTTGSGSVQANSSPGYYLKNGRDSARPLPFSKGKAFGTRLPSTLQVYLAGFFEFIAYKAQNGGLFSQVFLDTTK